MCKILEMAYHFGIEWEQLMKGKHALLGSSMNNTKIFVWVLNKEFWKEVWNKQLQAALIK